MSTKTLPDFFVNEGYNRLEAPNIRLWIAVEILKIMRSIQDVQCFP